MKNKNKKIVLICVLLSFLTFGVSYGIIKLLDKDRADDPGEVLNDINIALEVKLSSTCPEEIKLINNLENLTLSEDELGNYVINGKNDNFLIITYSDSTPEDISSIQYGVSISSFLISGDNDIYFSINEDDLDTIFDTLIVGESDNNKAWFNSSNLADEVVLSDALVNKLITFNELKTALDNPKITIEIEAEEIYQD